jgi:hypothetical protein
MMLTPSTSYTKPPDQSLVPDPSCIDGILVKGDGSKSQCPSAPAGFGTHGDAGPGQIISQDCIIGTNDDIRTGIPKDSGVTSARWTGINHRNSASVGSHREEQPKGKEQIISRFPGGAVGA